jgi:hypothetical protein
MLDGSPTRPTPLPSIEINPPAINITDTINLKQSLTVTPNPN